LELLRQTSQLLVGTHDFAGFSANRGVPIEDTVRTIRRIDVKGRHGGLITLTYEGDGFLYKMVRLLTGSLVRCAQKRAEPSWISELLCTKGKKTSFAAPAEGLYLVKVIYPANRSWTG
jgi:tRNA pseudouridine38-40 synthase